MHKYKILVTGEREELEDLVAPEKSVEWVQVPVLTFKRLAVPEQDMEKWIQTPYEWILFTSARTVKFWTETLLEHGLDFPIETQVACIGKNTANAASLDGFTPDFYPTVPGTEKFLEEFEDLISNNSKKPSVLIPMAANGRLAVRDRLSMLGCRVTVVPLYETKPREDVQTVLNETILQSSHLLLFTSPSSVDAVLERFSLPTTLKVGAIGSFTAEYLTKKGIPNVSILPEGNFQRVGEIL